jgi:Lrp/AsnC family transcriptional regulator, regulator for asnA, asnC and gidA
VVHERRETKPGPRSAGMVLDAASKAIIEQLQEDGRRAYAAIGRTVGLSEAAVPAGPAPARRRLCRWCHRPDAGRLPPPGDDRHRTEGALEPVADAMAQIPEVHYVVITAGSFDMLTEVVCEDDDHLLDLVSRRIRGVPGVRETESFVYLKLRKQLYSWPTR